MNGAIVGVDDVRQLEGPKLTLAFENSLSDQTLFEVRRIFCLVIKNYGLVLDV